MLPPERLNALFIFRFPVTRNVPPVCIKFPSQLLLEVFGNTNSPASRVRAPVAVLLPVKISFPAPFLVTPPMSVNLPAKSGYLIFSLLSMVNVLAPSATSQT